MLRDGRSGRSSLAEGAEASSPAKRHRSCSTAQWRRDFGTATGRGQRRLGVDHEFQQVAVGVADVDAAAGEFAAVTQFDLRKSEEQQLGEWTSAFGTPQQVALRCRIVLAAAEALSDYEIAAKLRALPP